MSKILSPAGTKEALIAAVQSGADEIYLGLSDFNARAGAENFTIDSLEPWVKYAHVRGAKIHVTMNTLLRDDELPLAEKLARSADEIGVDAFIVQDVGLAKRLCGNVKAALHASTQMTVYNAEGVRRLSELGFSRVVLSRELPLSEIKKIVDLNIMETEVFCHGALCMSYSGQCMLSFAGGKGRSGNRGTCSQPCRLKYRFEDSGDLASLLSPADLCSLPYIKELANTGVTSLKIEGRLKSPEYVAAVTRAYKYALSATDNAATDKLVDGLRVIFSRGGFSSGHQLCKMPPSAVTKDYAGRTGLYIGKSVGRGKALDGKVQSFRLPVLLEKPLSVGDGISFYGYPDFGGIINKIDNVDSIHASILVCGKLPPASGELHIYKTLDFALSKNLEQYKNPDLFLRKVPVSACFEISAETATLTFCDIDGNVSKAVTDILKSDGRCLTEPDISGIITATGNTPFSVSSCEIKGLSENVFLPFSELKKLRRNATEKLIELREERK